MKPRTLERKWQKKWESAKVFESEPIDGKEKYFVNCPYPYMNGYLHLGHAFTYLRADIVSRFQRMKGKNVLFPFAFHCTGTPIVAAAQATAWAWLPAETVATPWALSSGVSCVILWSAPRTLNEPVF